MAVQSQVTETPPPCHQLRGGHAVEHPCFRLCAYTRRTGKY